MFRRRQSEDHHRRGNASVTALSLGALLAFGALAVDVGYTQVANAQLAVAVEAGALGGSAYLDGTAAGVDAARAAAVTFANENPVVGGFTLSDADVEVGTWTEDDGFAPVTTIDDTTAKGIHAMRIDVSSSSLSSILAGVAFGRATLNTAAASLAVRDLGGPAGAVDCYLPIALPDCNFPTTPTSNPAPMYIVFGNSLKDNVGWAHPTNANPNNVQDQFGGLCDGSTLTLGGTVNLKNGVTTPTVDYVANLLNEAIDGPVQDWPSDDIAGPPDPREAPNAFPTTGGNPSKISSSHWGNVIEGPIALVAMGGTPGSCAGTANFNQDRTITGFTYGYLYDARDGNASTKGFMLQLDFVNEHELGTEADPDAKGNVVAPWGAPRLVTR